jgi:hypothetical protein
MHSRSEDNRTPVRPAKPTAGGQRRRLDGRIERLMGVMSELVRAGPCLWKESLRVLLTHSRPPNALKEFHKHMRAAVARAQYDEDFIDRILSAIDAADRARGLGDLLAPIRAVLISFVGAVSRRPSVLMAMAGRLIAGTGVELPPYLSFSTFDGKGRSLPLEKVDATLNIRVCVERAVQFLLGERARGSVAFSTWSDAERLAGLEALWLAYTYSEVGTANRGQLKQKDLQRDLERFGNPLWKQLDAAIRDSASERGEPGRRDLDAALGRLSLSVETGQAVSPPEAGDAVASALDRPDLSLLSQVVCRGAIPASSDKQDIQEIARHRVLEEALPVALMPAVKSLEATFARLVTEFPWASGSLAAVFDDLLGRANLGVRSLTLPATLFVGQPGAGKSRLARRIAEELGLPRLDVSLSGNSDTKLLGGTSRGWGSGRPSDLASLMAREQSASALVMLDEIDKARDHHHRGGGITDYLLPLLEPETASRHYDSFLKTECDFSMVSWICTANTLSGLSKPLLSRLRILLMPQPRRKDLPAVCAGVISEFERNWQMPTGTIPTASELGLDLAHLSSARQVRVATQAAVSHWARSIVRH